MAISETIVAGVGLLPNHAFIKSINNNNIIEHWQSNLASSLLCVRKEFKSHLGATSTSISKEGPYPKRNLVAGLRKSI